MIRISDGNAFKLRVTAMVNDMPGDLNVVTNMIVNFVRRGRIAQPHGIDSNGRLVISNDGSLARGLYGVEITGYHDGKPWRHYIKDAFKIVDENEDADLPTVVDDVPVYDLSDKMSFGGDGVTAEYVNAAISAHDGDSQSHEDLRQMIGDAGKVNDVQVDGESILDPNTKTANIDSSQFGKVDNVFVNGESVVQNKVANITIPTKASDLPNDVGYAKTAEVVQAINATANNLQTQINTKQDTITATVSPTVVEDGGNPSAEVTFENGNLGLAFKNLKGEKGNGIKSSSEVLSNVDGGVNTFTFIDSENIPHSFHTKNGQTGRPGADRQPVINGDVIIAHGTGGDEGKVMSQASVTKELLPVTGVDDRWTWQDGKRMHIANPSQLQSDAAFQTSYPLSVEVGDVVEVTTAGDGEHPFVVIAYLADLESAWVNKAAQNQADSTVSTYTWQADANGYVVVCGVTASMSASIVKANRLARLDELKDLERFVKDKTVAELTLTTEDGYYYSNTGNKTSNNNYKCTDFIDISQYKGYKLQIKLPSDYTSDSACHVIKDADGNIIDAVANSDIINSGRVYESPVIKDGYTIGFSGKKNKSISAFIIKSDVEDMFGVIGDVDKIAGDISEIERKLESTENINIPITQNRVTNYTKQIYIPTGVEYTLEFLPTEYIDASGLVLRITYSDDSVSGSFVIEPGSKKTRVESKDVKSFNFQRSASGAIGTGDVVMVLQRMDSIQGRIARLERNSSDNLMLFVSTSGSDTNDGRTLANAKATINAALASGAEIVMVDGGTYFMDIDLSKATRSRVSIKGVSGKKVIIKAPNTTICDDGSEELVSGYTKVYRVPVSYPHMPNRWLYFDGLNDEETLISAAERHPSQGGRFYRCDCTRIVRCNADSLEAALTEIESATNYRWYFDNGYLYFNRHSSTEVYPLMDSGTGSKHIKGNSTAYTPIDLEICNIEFRYEELNVVNLNSVHLSCVASKYVKGNGAILYDHTLNAVFENCEAARTCTDTLGDGFNAHAQGSDTGTKGTYVQLINCWSHDNCDDGYSDHEFSEILIVGGLFEYNGKAGVTPSYGSHCNGHNILSRKNYCGYCYIGTKQDGGNGGQMVLYNCVSDSNTRGGNQAGFYIDYGNDAILYNCIAMNEVTGFECSNAQMKAIDCKVVNCTTAKDGNITVINGTTLT